MIPDLHFNQYTGIRNIISKAGQKQAAKCIICHNIFDFHSFEIDTKIKIALEYKKQEKGGSDMFGVTELGRTPNSPQ